MIKKLFIIIMLVFFSLFPSVQAIGSYIDDPSPECGSENITITAKGVQTCVDIWIPNGCYANITFYYINWTTGWEQYAYWEYANDTMAYCAWNTNVSCYTEGDIRSLFVWRVKAEYNCPQQNYSWDEYFVCSFTAEPCELFYIHPDHNSTDVCPCCDSMCIGIENENGNSMNLTFYRNDTMNESFYIVSKYRYVNNGTYCFCIDGHIDDIYYPMKYNETYNWYVNVTDTVTGGYKISNVYNFTTAEYIEECPCGEDEIPSRVILVKRDLFLFFLTLAVIVLILLAYKKKKH